MNFHDTWWSVYTGNPGQLTNVPDTGMSSNEMKTFLTARYENVINHANNDYHITPMNRKYQIHDHTQGNPLAYMRGNDYRVLKANSGMASNKNDNLMMGGYGSLYFSNTNASNNDTDTKPWVFANV